jgi:hypothetical protein
MASETLGTDINGKVDFTLPKPVNCWNEALAASTVVTIPTPPNFNRAFFSFAIGTNVWVTYDGSAPVVPTTGATNTQELNPAGRQINMNGTDVIKEISDTASFINVRFDVGAS